LTGLNEIGVEGGGGPNDPSPRLSRAMNPASRRLGRLSGARGRAFGREAGKTPDDAARLDVRDEVNVPQNAVQSGVHTAPVLDGQGLSQAVKGTNQGVRHCGGLHRGLLIGRRAGKFSAPTLRS